MGQPGSQSTAFMHYATIGSLGDGNQCELPNSASLSSFFVSSIRLPWRNVLASSYWSTKLFCYIGGVNLPFPMS